MAPPGELVVTGATRRLCVAQFDFAPAGEGHRVLAERGRASARSAGRTPFVGRARELGLLRGRWQQAAAGLGQAVLVSGEAGIGKSRLLQELAAGIGAPGREPLELACSDLAGATELHPVAEHFREQLTGRAGGVEALLAGAGVPVADAPVVSALLRDGAGPRPAAPLRRTIEVVVAYVLARSRRGPLLATIEDLHWADPSTLALAGELVDAIAEAPVLLVLTFRPPLQAPWTSRGHLSHVALGPCTHEEAEAIAAHAGLPSAPARAIADRSGGIPLFAEELARSAAAGDAEGIPATLHDSLVARLGRLSPAARSLIRLGARIGQEFGEDLLLAASDLPGRDAGRALDELVHADLLRRRGRPPAVRYGFRHALLRESIVRSSAGRAGREMHRRIADAMERSLPALARAEPGVVAHHLEAAGEPRRAVAYRLDAGQGALERSAAPEAITQLSRGIEDLHGLDEGSLADELELALRVPLGNALLSARGYASAEAAFCYARARELCERTGNHHELAAVLYGLWVGGFVRGRHQEVLEIARELRRIAVQRDREARSVAERAVGWPLLCMGRFEEAREHLERIPALHDPSLHEPLRYRFGQDPGSSGLATLAWALWGCGDEDGARARAREAVLLARDTGHPLSVTYALGAGALLAAFLGDAALVRERADEALALTREFELPLWRGWSLYALGWAVLADGDAAGAATTIRAGLAVTRETGAVLFEPFALTVLADAEAQAGDAPAARRHLSAAEAAASAREERFWEPRTRRLRASAALSC
jgi:tetratricopeptide (TPR) repeat protein